DGLLYVSAAYGAGSAVVEIDRGKDGKWAVKERWKKQKSLQALFATPMVVDGYVYGCHGDLSAFALKCVDLKTGDGKSQERVRSREALLAVGGFLLTWSENGSPHLLELQPKQFVEKAQLPDLLTYKAWAAPAMADGRLFLRDQRNALCLDLRKP